MGRSFAGILAVVAWSTMVLRSAIAGDSPEGALLAATVVLFVFAGAGWVVGTVAESTIDSSVRTRFETELKAAEAAAAQGSGTK